MGKKTIISKKISRKQEKSIPLANDVCGVSYCIVLVALYCFLIAIFNFPFV